MACLKKSNYRKEALKYSIGKLICIGVLFCAVGLVQAQEDWPHVAASKD